MAAVPQPSPVTVSVVWNALLSVADEMGGALRRTAVSAAVREGDDFSTGLFDRHGRLIAQGNFTPGHLGAMPYVVKTVMQTFPVETMREGDGFFLNDSFLGSGHFPDCFLISPAFLNGTLMGFVVNTAHHVDVGGAAPGSQKVHGVTEAFQEGLRILPVRLVRDGAIDRDLMTIIRGNVRAPETVASDIQAQINANYVGCERLLRIYQEHGQETLDAAIEAILDQSEARMRDFISALPDGSYGYDDVLDDCGPNGRTVRLAVDVEIHGDEMSIDFSRSDDQIDVALNSYINYTRAYSIFAVKVFADALLPQNDGAIRPIRVSSREGSFFNPQFPAPSGGRATVQVRIFELINGALAQAIPDKAMGSFSHWGNPNISGRDDASGETFIMYDLIFGGYGARSFKDGAEAMAPIVNCTNIPIEIQETLSPIRVQRFELIPDSGGDGQYRGGCGVRKDIEILSSQAIVTLLGDRHVKAPSGLFKGADGALAQTLLLRQGKERDLTSKQTLDLQRHDVVSFRLSGGGGYGPVAARSPEAVQHDLENGFITKEHAAHVYGFGGDRPVGDQDENACARGGRKDIEHVD